LLDHPNSVKVLASGTTPAGISYLVMELYVGDSFDDELERGPVSVARAAEIVMPVCRVLALAHALGIIHRDIKPANVFLHRDATGAEIVKVVDFGIAKLEYDFDLRGGTTVGRVVGTPLYMAPERLLGKSYDGRVDVYSVGMMIFRALTGTFPFPTPDALGALIMTCVHDPPMRLAALRPDVPKALDALVLRLIAKSPDDRPAMAEIPGLLEDAIRGYEGVPTAGTASSPPLADTLDAPISPVTRKR
jgi:serine/threonine-protein kinase